MTKTALLSLLIILSSAVPSFALPSEISIAADLWCPYTCEPNGREGILIDISRKIFSQNNIDVKYRFMPWTRARSETEKGLHNAIIGAFESDAKGFILPSSPILYGTNGFFTLASNTWQYSGIDSLKGLSLGIIEGYAYGSPVDEYIKSHSSSSRIQFSAGADALRKNLTKLVNKKVDVILDEPRVVRYEWKDLGYPASELKRAGVYGKEGIWIAFSPRRTESEELANIFSVGLEKLEKIGEVQRIADMY